MPNYSVSLNNEYNIKSINMQHKTQPTPTFLCDQNCLFFDGHFKQNVLEIFGYRKVSFLLHPSLTCLQKQSSNHRSFLCSFCSNNHQGVNKGKALLRGFHLGGQEKENYVYAQNHRVLLRLW